MSRASITSAPSARTRAAAALAMVAILLIALAALAPPARAFGEDKDHDKDYSLYKLSSSFTAFYEATHNADKPDDTKKFEIDSAFQYSTKVGSAGVYVGFLDQDYDNGIIGSLFSQFSSASMGSTYNAYVYGGQSHNGRGLRQYVYYGRALANLGVDSADSEGSIFKIFYLIASFGMKLPYFACEIANSLFTGVIGFLVAFNPFAVVGGKIADVVPIPDALVPVRDMIGPLINAASGLGLVIWGLFTVPFAIFAYITMTNSRRDSGKWRSILTKLAVVAVGVPLLGGTYTAALDITKGMLTDPMTVNANRVLGTTFVDFERWAGTQGLNLPEGYKVSIDTGSGDARLEGGKTLHELVWDINRISGADITLGGGTGGGKIDDVINTNAPDQKTADTVSAGLGLLDRWGAEDFYRASDFESTLKGVISNGDGDAADAEKFYKSIKAYGKSSKLIGDGGVKLNDGDNHPDGQSPLFAADYSLKASGGATNADTTISYWGDGSVNTGSGKAWTRASSYGLAPLAVYNYLNTSFTNAGITIYSSHKITSGFVRESHPSVVLAGSSGLDRFFNYFYAGVMLTVIAIVGVMYAAAMFMATIGRTFKAIMHMPLAAMGSLRAMSKLTCMVAMIIVEVWGTVFAYSIIMTFLTVLDDVAIGPVLGAFGTVGLGALTFLSPFISAIILILFCIMALRIRKAIVKSFDEITAKAIDRIFGTDAQGGGAAAGMAAPKKGAISRMASGAAAGAGAGLVTAGLAAATGGVGAAALTLGKNAVAGGIGSAVGSKGGDAAGGGVEGSDRVGGPGGAPGGGPGDGPDGSDPVGGGPGRLDGAAPPKGSDPTAGSGDGGSGPAPSGGAPTPGDPTGGADGPRGVRSMDGALERARRGAIDGAIGGAVAGATGSPEAAAAIGTQAGLARSGGDEGVRDVAVASTESTETIGADGSITREVRAASARGRVRVSPDGSPESATDVSGVAIDSTERIPADAAAAAARAVSPAAGAGSDADQTVRVGGEPSPKSVTIRTREASGSPARVTIRRSAVVSSRPVVTDAGPLPSGSGAADAAVRAAGVAAASRARRDRSDADGDGDDMFV